MNNAGMPWQHKKIIEQSKNRNERNESATPYRTRTIQRIAPASPLRTPLLTQSPLQDKRKKKPQAFPPAAYACACPLRLRTLYLSYRLSHRRIHSFRVAPTRLREAGLTSTPASD